MALVSTSQVVQDQSAVPPVKTNQLEKGGVKRTAAGYLAAAMDLRGYGGSDHTPRGYDPFAASLDVVGVIRSLGEERATIVGHGWGGFLAWTAGALHPEAVAGLVPVSMGHPRRLRDAIVGDTAQLRASGYVLGFQRPWVPERQLVADDARRIGIRRI